MSSRLKFEFDSDIDKAKFLTVIATELFSEMVCLDAFWNGIPNDKKFTHTDLDTPLIKETMEVGLFGYDLKISFYRSSWFFRNVVGHVKNGKPFTIFINTRHKDFKKLKGESLEDDIRDKIETIAHEIVHLIDMRAMFGGFGHGDNSPVGKENSFPYWFGRYAANFFKHEEFHTKLRMIRGSY